MSDPFSEKPFVPDASIDLVNITERIVSPWASFDQTTQALMASISTVNFLERTDPITQGIEVSTDGGQTFTPIVTADHGCPPQPNRRGVIPGTYDVFIDVSVQGSQLYRSFVDPHGVALTTTASISQS